MLMPSYKNMFVREYQKKVYIYKCNEMEIEKRDSLKQLSHL